MAPRNASRVKLQDLPGATRSKRKRTTVTEAVRVGNPSQPAKVLTSEEIEESERKRQEAKRRRSKKRLEELERTNFRDARSEINLGGGSDERALSGERASAAAQLAGLLAAAQQGHSDEEDKHAGPSSGSKTGQKQSAKVKAILSGKRNLQSLIDGLRSDRELSAMPNYLTATAPPSAYPIRHLCSVDGYWGDITCSKCGDRVCGLACLETHRETRCDKFF